MFTGLIQSIGTVLSSAGGRLLINAPFKGVKRGESIAVDGVCLTAVSILKSKGGSRLGFDVSEETLKKTTLGLLSAGRPVNLERAARFGDSIGGHFVQGHVDGVGKIRSIRSLPFSKTYEFFIPAFLRDHLAPKGSIAVDGISLTVAEILKDSFTSAIIPHTESHTSLGAKQAGDAVNLETDMLAKHIHRLMSAYRRDGRKRRHG